MTIKVYLNNKRLRTKSLNEVLSVEQYQGSNEKEKSCEQTTAVREENMMSPWQEGGQLVQLAYGQNLGRLLRGGGLWGPGRVWKGGDERGESRGVAARNPENIGAGDWLRRERPGMEGHRSLRTGHGIVPKRTVMAKQRDWGCPRQSRQSPYVFQAWTDPIWSVSWFRPSGSVGRSLQEKRQEVRTTV